MDNMYQIFLGGITILGGIFAIVRFLLLKIDELRKHIDDIRVDYVRRDDLDNRIGNLSEGIAQLNQKLDNLILSLFNKKA